MHCDDVTDGFHIYISITVVQVWSAVCAETALARLASKKSGSDTFDREVA